MQHLLGHTMRHLRHTTAITNTTTPVACRMRHEASRKEASSGGQTGCLVKDASSKTPHQRRFIKDASSKTPHQSRPTMRRRQTTPPPNDPSTKHSPPSTLNPCILHEPLKLYGVKGSCTFYGVRFYGPPSRRRALNACAARALIGIHVTAQHCFTLRPASLRPHYKLRHIET